MLLLSLFKYLLFIIIINQYNIIILIIYKKILFRYQIENILTRGTPLKRGAPLKRRFPGSVRAAAPPPKDGPARNRTGSQSNRDLSYCKVFI